MEIHFEFKSPNVDLEISNVKECMFFAFTITSKYKFQYYLQKRVIIVHVINQVGGVGD